MASQTNISQIKNYSSRISEKQALGEFLLENDLTYGYATYWNAFPTTFFSNGAIKNRQIGVAEDAVTPQLWGASYAWFDYTEDHGNKTFFLLTESEMQTFAPNGLDNSRMDMPESVLEYAGYKILVYP